MDPEIVFMEKLSKIHGLSPGGDHHRNDEINIRHEEFQAMADAFLGENYDVEKLKKVEHEQVRADEMQMELVRKYQSKELSPEEYVDSLNDLMLESFTAIEKILGEKDFKSLFGGEPSDCQTLIDKESFIQEEESKEHSIRPGDAVPVC